MRIVRTKRYVAELAAIGDYIAEHNPRAARKVVSDIDVTMQHLLSANPFIGRLGEIAGTRELVVPGTPYIVAYRVTDVRGRGPIRPARRAPMAERGFMAGRLAAPFERV